MDKVKKLVLVFTSLFLIYSPLASSVFADTSETDPNFVIEDNTTDTTQPDTTTDTGKVDINTKYFDIKLSLGTQSAWNNSIPLIIQLTPKIDSEKTEITFDTPIGLQVTSNYKKYFVGKKGNTYELTGTIKPSKAGVYRIAVNAIAWQYNTNYTSSQTITLELDKNLKIVPQTQAYYVGVVIKYFVFALIAGGIVALIVVFGKKGLKKLKVWMTPEE